MNADRDDAVQTQPAEVFTLTLNVPFALPSGEAGPATVYVQAGVKEAAT